MRHLFVSLVALASLVFVVEDVKAGFLFDNGSYSGPQVGRFNTTNTVTGQVFTIYDDFTLASASTVSGIHWTEHDVSVNYISTTITLYSGTPSAASQIYSATLVASRTLNNNPVLFGIYSGFDYNIDGLSIGLNAGTYYLGIHENVVAGGATTWDETTGNGSTIQGRYQTDTPPTAGNFFANENSAFQILGSPAAQAAPEPASLTMLCIGAACSVCWQWRRRQIARA